MEDSLSQDSHQYDHLSSTTPVANSVLMVPRTADDESNNLSHIHLLHRTVTTDPNLNRHNRRIVDNNQYQHEQVLQYFTDTSNERLKLIKSKSIITPSPPPTTTTNSSVGTNYDPNSDINFLYDLVTPPSTTTTISRQSIQSQSSNNDTAFFDDHWSA